MDGFATSTIAALCYANRTDIDFAALADELGRALWANPQGRLEIRNVYDDFVVFDLATMRITLAHTDFRADAEAGAPNPAFEECIIVAVGPGPDGCPPAPGFDDRAALCQGFVDRISRQVIADRMIVREYPGAFDSDGHDALVEEIATPRGEALRQRPDPVTEELMWELATKAWDRAAEAEDKVLDAEVIVVEPPRPTHPEAAADRVGAERLRRAKPHRPRKSKGKGAEPATTGEGVWDDDIDRQPLVHRAAVNALSAAMLVFALPVGAALITLSVLGRESLGVSSRMTAVTGATMGFVNSETGQSLLAAFV